MTSTSVPYSASCTYAWTDANGDGLDDLGCISGSSTSYYLHNGTSDLATSFADGYGNSVSPSYVSMVQSNYLPYQYGNPSSGYANYLAPLYLVSEATFSDPSTSGGTYYKTFLYSGAWINLQGRGFSNFSNVQTFDSRTGLYENVFYGFTFPYSGMMFGDSLRQTAWPSSPVEPVKEWNCSSLGLNTLDSTVNNQRYFPTCSSTSLSQYELGGSENGDLITTTVTNYTFDNFGNATSIVKTVTDEDPGSPYTGDTWTTTTTNTTDISGSNQSADLAQWCLTMPDETQVVYSSTINGSNTA